MSLELLNPAQYTHIESSMLEQVFLIQNPSNHRRCNDRALDTITQLLPKDCTVVRRKGSMLIRKGTPAGPHPYYLAHLDQVHDYAPEMELWDDDGDLLALDANDLQCGVGGDDKCGIYVALKMLHMLDHVTVVFVRDEEVGCEGSSEVPLTWFKHASFVIQFDRNNFSMDIISDTNGMHCASKEFIKAVLDLPQCVESGHTENMGSVTDIGELSNRGLQVSMLNISSGYHEAHSRHETVDLRQLDIACQVALEIATKLGDKKWEHKPHSSWIATKRSNKVNRYMGYDSNPPPLAGEKSGAWAWDDDDDAYSTGYYPKDSPVQRALSKLNADELAAAQAAEATADLANTDTDYWNDVDGGLENHGAYTRDHMVELLENYGYDRHMDGLHTLSSDQLEKCALQLGFSVRVK